MRDVNARYVVYTDDGQSYQIKNATWQLTEDSFTVETDLVERSFTDGAVAVGISRTKMKEIAFQMQFYEDKKLTFRQKINEALYFFRKAVLIRDLEFNIETDIRLTEGGITYEIGTYNHNASINITFQQIIPYWRDVDFQEISESVHDTSELEIENDGFYDTPAYFILRTEQEIPKFLIKELNTGLGIGIADLQFGKQNLDTYVIDNENGEALLGSAETGGILRNNRILQGTGFFFLKRGINNLKVYTWLNRELDFACRYKRRYFI